MIKIYVLCFFFSSGELSFVTVMEDVCKKTGVRDQQLEQEISESDIILFAEKFPHLNVSINHT